MSLGRFGFLILCAVLSRPVAGQVTLLDLPGISTDGEFGFAASGAGDVNGDGVPDVIVGSHKDDTNGLDSGTVRVHSGIDGTILYAFFGDTPGIFFGYSANGAGDVNADGYDDFIIGALLDDGNGPISGSAQVFSGFDGTVLYQIDGDAAFDRFGRSVDGAGDVNGDGYADFIVGAPFDDNGGTNSGTARVFSGINGAILHSIDGDSADDHLGYSVNGAGDVDADGYDDFIVGIRLDDANAMNAGRARVYSGFDGSILHTFDGVAMDDWFGFSVAGGGDINGDGFDDVVVGSPNANAMAGNVRAYSGFDGALLHDIDGTSAGALLGWSVAIPGDMDGDGFDDFAGGAPSDNTTGATAGSMTVWSGLDHSVILFVGGAALDDLGFAVNPIGDLNGDGLDDVVIGSPDAVAAVPKAGRATVTSSEAGVAKIPRAPIVGNPTETTLTLVAISGNGNPPTTEYAVDVAGGYLDLTGAIAAPETWATEAAWAGLVVPNLLPNTFHEFRVKARGAAGLETFLGPKAGLATLSNLGPGADGTVGLNGGFAGGPFDVIFVNGSAGGAARLVTVPVGAPFSFEVLKAPASAAETIFVIWGRLGTPGPAEVFTLGFGIGDMCFPPCVADASNPILFNLVDGFAVGGCAPLIPDGPTPFQFSAPAGIPVTTAFSLQGLMFVSGAGLANLAVTNMLRVSITL